MTTEQLANLRLEALKLALLMHPLNTVDLINEADKIFEFILSGTSPDKVRKATSKAIAKEQEIIELGEHTIDESFEFPENKN